MFKLQSFSKGKMMFHAKKKKCNRCQIGESIELKLKCCSQCKCTYYCNISCQRMDWQKHKLYCAEMRQNSIDLAMGTEFITTTEKWFLDHESLLKQLAVSAMKISRIKGHVLFLFTTYFSGTIQLVPEFKVLSFQEMEAISVEAKASVDSITKAVERHETPGRTIFLSLQCSGLPYPLGGLFIKVNLWPLLLPAHCSVEQDSQFIYR